MYRVARLLQFPKLQINEKEPRKQKRCGRCVPTFSAAVDGVLTSALWMTDNNAIVNAWCTGTSFISLHATARSAKRVYRYHNSVHQLHLPLCLSVRLSTSQPGTDSSPAIGEIGRDSRVFTVPYVQCSLAFFYQTSCCWVRRSPSNEGVKYVHPSKCAISATVDY